MAAALPPEVPILASIPLKGAHLPLLLRVIHRATVDSGQATLRRGHILDVLDRQDLELRQLRLLFDDAVLQAQVRASDPNL